MKSIKELIEESPFFEVFEKADLEFLAQSAKMKTVPANKAIFEEGQSADLFYMLVVGKVELAFTPKLKFAREDERRKKQILIRFLSDPGRPIGWSSMVHPYQYRATATAIEDTQLLSWSAQSLREHSDVDPKFGITFQKRLLWVLGNRLRAVRVRLVAQRYEKETLAIRALIDQSAENLHVTSPLHKIPHFLENRLTLTDAFQTLELLRVHGDPMEKNVSELCLDILESVRSEMVLFQYQQDIYEAVANAPVEELPETIREKCLNKFSEMFHSVSHVVRGLENLPEKPGHIIFMNHLSNHPDNMLPNEFQLTLDTHFVSSMILFPKYKDSPIRVVRKSKANEYGHQMYFDRLGYVYVYSGLIDETNGEPEELKSQRRRYFLETAAGHLRAGRNVIICPEGTSTATEKSPGAFKTGAFRLAAFTRPEPLMIPISVANFDKKLKKTTVVAVVHKPFKLSEYVSDPENKEALYSFIDSQQKKFQMYVRQASLMPGRVTTQG